jgi:hypothetical protein
MKACRPDGRALRDAPAGTGNLRAPLLSFHPVCAGDSSACFFAFLGVFTPVLDHHTKNLILVDSMSTDEHMAGGWTKVRD